MLKRAIRSLWFLTVTSCLFTVTAEVAGSSPVVPAINQIESLVYGMYPKKIQIPGGTQRYGDFRTAFLPSQQYVHPSSAGNARSRCNAVDRGDLFVGVPGDSTGHNTNRNQHERDSVLRRLRGHRLLPDSEVDGSVRCDRERDPGPRCSRLLLKECEQFLIDDIGVRGA